MSLGTTPDNGADAMNDDESEESWAHAFVAEYVGGISSHIPAAQQAATCCCGNASCAYLQHTTTILEGLERDVCTAATLGKVRLIDSPTSKREQKRRCDGWQNTVAVAYCCWQLTLLHSA